MTTDASSLFTALVSAEIRAWNAVESALCEANNPLSLGRFLVLHAVRDTPACRIQEVAASQGITLGAASRLVDRLHRDGLLHRTPCEHDRRATILTVTDTGMTHLASAEAIVAAEQERLLAPLSPGQRERLAHALALIDEAADPTAGNAPARGKGRA
ncbi:MarR family transcriptional regulator [Actinomyces bouchesdurhonensis]|uniref:MarR family winged helix-turn-helix transcriptional regulator n=1 Tax=Actinomyces bouchesdurhonensis TaxID=1852361 RepID=UPI0028E709B8|nr:MarR family transcriptional regulator [Actinomyces bouchesdurhonensis]